MLCRVLEQSIPAYAGWAWSFLWLSVGGRPSRLATLLWVSLLFLFNACHLSLTFAAGMGLLFDFMWQAEAFWNYFRCRHSCWRVTALSATSQPGRDIDLNSGLPIKYSEKDTLPFESCKVNRASAWEAMLISDDLNWNSKESQWFEELQWVNFRQKHRKQTWWNIKVVLATSNSYWSTHVLGMSVSDV